MMFKFLQPDPKQNLQRLNNKLDKLRRKHHRLINCGRLVSVKEFQELATETLTTQLEICRLPENEQ